MKRAGVSHVGPLLLKLHQPITDKSHRTGHALAHRAEHGMGNFELVNVSFWEADTSKVPDVVLVELLGI